MKSIFLSVVLSLALFGPARADLTIVQKVEGLGPVSEMTIKVKGDMVRIDMSAQASAIFNTKTGEMLNLMNDEKTVVRVSSDKMKAAAEMIRKFSSQKDAPEKPKLVATGEKETVNGYETERYVCDGPNFKVTYWIALNYPKGPEILKQLQAVKSEVWDAASAKFPDYRDCPGLPLRTRMVLKKGEGTNGGSEVTSTINSVKLEPLSDSEFAVPPDFKEAKIPAFFDEKNSTPSAPPRL